MDGKGLARIAAIVFVAFAITAAAMDLARQNEPTVPRLSGPIGAETSQADPLDDMLVRCQSLGEVAVSNADCLAAWAENRRRFLGESEGR